jgi:hypothetical protein
MVEAPPGGTRLLSDAVIASPLCSGNAAAQALAGTSDPDLLEQQDPELAMVLRMSLAEEEQRQARAAAAAGAAAPAPAAVRRVVHWWGGRGREVLTGMWCTQSAPPPAAAAGSDPMDADLQAALRMSMNVRVGCRTLCVFVWQSLC